MLVSWPNGKRPERHLKERTWRFPFFASLVFDLLKMTGNSACILNLALLQLCAPLQGPVIVEVTQDIAPKPYYDS